MRATVIAIGSRGDVQPLVSLASGMSAAGFDITVATHADFETMVREHGLKFRVIEGKSADFYGGAAANALAERLRNKKEFLRFFEQYMALFLDRLLISCWEAAQDTDAVLCWPWTRIAPSLAARLKIPVIIVAVSPVLHLPTWSFANPYQEPLDLDLGPLYNRITWLRATAFTKLGQVQVDKWRERTLGLPAEPWRAELRRLRRLPHLFGFSPSVLPRPVGWAEWIHVTGYWFLDRPVEWKPPAELEAFLAAGPAPVGIGFSSSVGKSRATTTKITLDALERSGARGILISGFGGLGKGASLPENVFAVRSVPYDWLLPRVAAMVHHGGAGSTSAALRFGVPSFAIPFAYEQALWGKRIAAIGAGVSPIPAKKLTADKLAASIREVMSRDDLRRGAARIADTLRHEDGVSVAVNRLIRLLDPRPLAIAV